MKTLAILIGVALLAACSFNRTSLTPLQPGMFEVSTPIYNAGTLQFGPEGEIGITGSIARNDSTALGACPRGYEKVSDKAEMRGEYRHLVWVVRCNS